MKITVVGLGYVGLSNAVLLSRCVDVTALDVDCERVSYVNEKRCPIVDSEISNFLETKPLKLVATTDKARAYSNSDIVIVSTPTNFDDTKNAFDTSIVQGVVTDALKFCQDALIVIKSTVPIGFVDGLTRKYSEDLQRSGCEIIFSPEFLREGKALADNLKPSRIIVGGKSEKARVFGELLVKASDIENPPLLFMTSSEAEATKLFSNTFLAMRVAFFNELDSFAMNAGLDAKNIVDGLGLDPRIGSHYNNPSFGYGGYCLPKDTRQLLSQFTQVPQNIMSAIVASNEARFGFLADEILNRLSREQVASPQIIGVYRLAMKAGSDNFRASSILEVVSRLKSAGSEVVVYEPSLDCKDFEGLKIVDNLDEFKKKSSVILANRVDEFLKDCEEKVFSRDIYGHDS